MRQKLRITIPTEYQECKAFWEYASYTPEVGKYLIKLTNEGKREAWYGRSLLNIGMRPGIPDYFYAMPNEKYHGLWLEMKKSDGANKRKDPKQDQWIESLNANKYFACYAYGSRHAIQIMVAYTSNKL